jgi:sigma-B regulation protein RsbU (phosphoserine phosphatase)
MRDALRHYVHDLEVTTAAKQRLESELAIAGRIQLNMLPPGHAGSPAEGYELGAVLEPAREVGGDLFDHSADGERVFFLVADVSGKGVPAALFMARAKTLFEAAAARQLEPSAILAAVNRGLCRENEAGVYVTAACGVLELATGELCFACAGHEPPLRLCPGAVPAPLQTEGGAVLGLLDLAAFPQSRVRLSPGEAVFAFTDGVDEAFSPQGELFGKDRLLACLEPLAAAPVERVNRGVREAVAAFAGEARQSDDITVLTLRYLGPPGERPPGLERPRGNERSRATR